MMWDSGMGGGMGWMWFFWLLLIVGTVVIVIVLVLVLLKALTGSSGDGSRQGGSAPPTGARPRRSREILEERYARGEISTEEFSERLRTLEEGDR
ncbi:SHOCT domain-containing protein [Nesterenkonia sp. LB17]|uniref:SHOCT domain-containing protein n=1 Tax=Nesterenkonia sp. LB17 TaxID=2901230 RepID=UPI001F4C72AC|nr:SHOCT domain-containing protein [Nesterenkonia sp. LB17]MCH8565667.1 SHOCT domain-containing protein [Nesterenkonia sp. LB17]